MALTIPHLARQAQYGLRSCVLALLAALVMSQTLGLMHRSLHSPLTSSGYALFAEQAHLPAHRPAESSADAPPHTHGQHHASDCDHGWLSALFAQHDDESSCRLMDAQTSSDAVVFAQQALLPAPLNALWIAFSQITSTARAAALFEARGPPQSL